MEKVLLIDVALDGHHIPYIKNILKIKNDYDYVLIVPKTNIEFDVRKITVEDYDFKKISDYKKWIDRIIEVIKDEKPNVVHLLFGDILYRFFGYRVNEISKVCHNFVVTFHQLKPQLLARISERMLFKKISKPIITTEFNYNLLLKRGIKNIYLHEIPHLYEFPLVDMSTARKKFDIPNDVMVFGSFGILSEYKRIDLLLDAFNLVQDKKFCLIIAGKPDYYDEKMISNKIIQYNDKVKLFLKYLPDDDFFYLINSCDYVVTPYSLNFNGSSGPLTEAVWARKRIISSDLRSLGDIVKNNDLGYVFHTDDLNSLVEVLKKSFEEKTEWSSVAEEYRTRTSIEYFIKRLHEIYSS